MPLDIELTKYQDQVCPAPASMSHGHNITGWDVPL
jgi:hypothetical protein